jgi:type I restriction enzyme S subunit
MTTLAQGATRYNLSKVYFNAVVISVPNQIEEQKAIAEVLSNMDAEIQALQDERNKYALIKQGMMQELLTGKTRI